MSTFSTRTALAAVGLAALAPAAAQAATKTVAMGPPAKSQKAIGKLGGDVDDFFPHTITVHVGDKVKFAPVGFHSVDIPKKGGSPIGLAGPSGNTATENDAAGQPFWFNGQPDIEFSAPLVSASGFGKTFSYKGTKAVLSGLPLGNNLKAMTVKFAKAGSYTYFCNVHAGMTGVVKVVAKGKKIPNAKQDAKTVAKQVASATATLKKLQTSTPPAGTVDVGPSSAHGATLFAFAPSTTTIPVGTTLKFELPAGSLEVHTATFGPDDPGVANGTGYLAKLANSIGGQPPFDQAGVYPSDNPASGPAAITLTSHGNGFWNTGFMDANSASPLPGSGSVTFTQAGTYNFYCVIHPFMHAVITVQ